MSNIASFSVTQYGSTFLSVTKLLNMDRFSQVMDNGNSTTLVMYTPFGTEYQIPVVINETLAAVNAKLAAKTPPRSCPLLIISQGGTTYNSVLTLESGYFVNAQAAPNPTQSILSYQSFNGDAVNYIVSGTLSYILGQIISPVSGASIGGTAVLTTSPETITLSHDFGAAGNFIFEYSVVDGGGFVNKVTNISGTQVEIETGVQPLTINYSATAI